MAAAVRESGHLATVTDDFQEATALLTTGVFAALITAHVLGAHDGLHLILRARAGRPAVAVVVTLPRPDPVVEAEATALGAVCVVEPWDDSADLLEALSRVDHAVAV